MTPTIQCHRRKLWPLPVNCHVLTQSLWRLPTERPKVTGRQCAKRKRLLRSVGVFKRPQFPILLLAIEAAHSMNSSTVGSAPEYRSVAQCACTAASGLDIPYFMAFCISERTCASDRLLSRAILLMIFAAAFISRSVYTTFPPFLRISKRDKYFWKQDHYTESRGRKLSKLVAASKKISLRRFSCRRDVLSCGIVNHDLKYTEYSALLLCRQSKQF